ncbi:hypothetical protein HPB47_021450, partial [Ixodes persulcatus]
SQVTRLMYDIDAAIASHSDERSLNVLSVRLSELRTQLSNVNASIEPLVLDGDVEQNYARTIEYDDKIVTYIASIAQEVEELRRARPQAGTTRIHNDGDGHVATSNCRNWSFNGLAYKQAIHDNDSLSNAEKFLYLRSALTGKAASAIAGIQATGENYDTVVELLRERFGRTDVSFKNTSPNYLICQQYDTRARGADCDVFMTTCNVIWPLSPRSGLRENDGIKIESLQSFLKLEVESVKRLNKFVSEKSRV